jgi:hypothetical protein
LVVESLRRHTGHNHCPQASDIDTGFHGRSNAEQVNSVYSFVLVVKEDVLKTRLSRLTIFVVCLA